MPPTPQGAAPSRREFLCAMTVLGGVTAMGDGRAQTPGAALETNEDMPMVDGLTTVPSSFAARETADRLEAAARSKGLTMFARIDHAAGAAEVGLPLRPTELLIFGNARGGTPVIQAAQSAGIDLPLKALVYEDAAGKVWLAYNDPAWIARRHGVGSAVDANVKVLAAALAALATQATQSA